MFSVLDQVKARYNVRFQSYCLMGNHYHLVLETPEGNLAQAMRQLNGVYSQGFNRRHGRVGHLFQGRYRSLLVEEGRHLVELARYVVLNPVRAGLVERPEDWEWSSYGAALGLVSCPPFLSVDGLLAAFGSFLPDARQAYRTFVEAGLDVDSRDDELPAPPLLGSREFALAARRFLSPTPSWTEVPRVERLIGRPELKEIFGSCTTRDDRNKRIIEALVSHGYSMKQIADAVGIHYSTVSRVVRQQAAMQES